MPSKTVADLSPVCREKAQQVISLAKDRGADIRIYCTLRTPEEQARLYRQSRTLSQVMAKADALRRKGYPSLADILIGVGAQDGKLGAHVTNAGPGESWHQYREAFDAAPFVGGEPTWDVKHPHWKIYGDCVRRVGLQWAGDWTSFPEYPHAQNATGGNPLDVLTPEQVKARMG